MGDLLLSIVDELPAGLLVVDCYGHSRAREWMFGGATRTMFPLKTIPVSMSH